MRTIYCKSRAVSAYSNWGAALAAYIIEMVSGQSYQKYVKERILKPLRMKNTSIGPFQNDNPKIIEKKAIGYSFAKNKFKKEPYMYLRMYPAGGMNGSSKDLLRYAQELDIIKEAIYCFTVPIPK